MYKSIGDLVVSFQWVENKYRDISCCIGSAQSAGEVRITPPVSRNRGRARRDIRGGTANIPAVAPFGWQPDYAFIGTIVWPKRPNYGFKNM